MVKPLRCVFAIAAFGAGAAIACGPGFLDGISGGTRADGGTVAKSDSGSTDGGSCNHAGLSPRPPGDDPTENLSLPVFAFDGLRIDTLPDHFDAGAAIPQGLDLDQTCTCESQPDSCQRPKNTQALCDGPDGRDDAFGTLFNQLSIGIPLFPTSFATDRIRGGHFSILIDLLGWNGKAEDPNVQVAVRQSAKLDGDSFYPDGGRHVPAFDGTDVWTVDPATISGGADTIGKDCQDPANAFACIAVIRDAAAYVTGMQLFARPRIPGSGDPVTITLRTSVGVITLSFQDFGIHANITGPDAAGHYRLDGELTGRVSATNLNTMFGNLQDFTSSDQTKVICNNSQLFATAKTGVCALRDLTLTGDAGGPCDAISAALAFGASAANAGTVYQEDPLPSQCGDTSFTCDD